MDTIKSMNDIYTLSPTQLEEILRVGNFISFIPQTVDTIESMDAIANLLPELVNKYSFLMSALSSLKVSIRTTKREGDKQAAEDLIDKQTIISNAVEILKMQQKTLSRVITIKQMVNDEIKMY